MNAVTAFSHREDILLAQLEQAQDLDGAIDCCAMALEQTACELAQDEQDEMARQRQQAVMACVRRAPQLLRAACARGELVLEEAKEEPGQKLHHGAKTAGAFLLGALAVYEIIDGDMLFALFQLLGAHLLLWGGKEEKQSAHARGVAGLEPQAAVRYLRELCQAADVCVSDLMLLERDAGFARLSGTADEATLDLLVSLLEAKESGRSELVLGTLLGAEQYLHMLGIEVVRYDEGHAQLFDVLPTLGEARTVRPALVRDGQALRRGIAAVRAEGRAKA